MMGNKSGDEAAKAGAIANQISTTTIKKVIIGVLIMLITMPNLEADRPNEAKYRQLVQLHYVGAGPDASGTALAKLMPGNVSTCAAAAAIEHNMTLDMAVA